MDGLQCAETAVTNKVSDRVQERPSQGKPMQRGKTKGLFSVRSTGAAVVTAARRLSAAILYPAQTNCGWETQIIHDISCTFRNG